MRVKALIYCVFFFLLFTAGCVGNDVIQVSETYLRALAAQDYPTAKAITTGQALYNLSKNEVWSERLKPAKVIDLSTGIITRTNSVATVHTVTETETADGDSEVMWYDLVLEKRDGEWKVSRATLTAPEMSGPGGRGTRAEDVAAAKKVFEKYLKAMAANDWDAALKCLSGPARITQEMSRPVLGKSAVIKHVGEVTLQGLWQEKKTLFCKSKNEVDGRTAERVYAFYKTTQGWKIVVVK